MSITFNKLKQHEDEEAKYEYNKRTRDYIRSNQMVEIDRKGQQYQLIRRLQQEELEERLEKDIFEERKRKELQAEQKERAQKKAEAEMREYRENLRTEKLKQQLCTGTEELRELERKLRACYVGKENHLRIKEKELASSAEKILVKREREAEIEMRKEEKERERLLAEDRERQKYAFRLAQQQQLIEAQRRREEAYKAFVKEKLMMDLIAQEICEEDRQKELSRLMAQKATRKEIDDFLEAREQWKRRLREEMDQENMRIQKYMESQTDRNAELRQAMKEKWDKHNERANLIASQLYAERKRAMEKELILHDLAEVEMQQAHEKRLRDELEAAIRKRIDLRISMCQQRKDRAIALQKEQVEEEELRKKMLEDLAEQERLEQMTRERKRVKMAEHRAAVDRILQERRFRRQLEYEKIMRDYEGQQEEERQYERLVEEERLRILREHAHNLLGYLPKDILREGDSEKLGPEFLEALRNHSRGDTCF